MSDKEIFKFAVLWEGWECDATAWVMERPDGTRYLLMTDHGGGYVAGPKELMDRISAYEAATKDAQQALKLLAERRGHNA